MREVQVTCSRCGRLYAYLEAEPGDYTSISIPINTYNQKCPSCGYPDNVIWETNKWVYNDSK